ncbi:hypothetical protein [Acinetobacter soli]|uniref:hypothetical protein n=1 Tax=Acinetobacter soli TaxID=487316 RepID=UPI0026DFE68F|nr:hypothetical protein [Acinetobacter soli]
MKKIYALLLVIPSLCYGETKFDRSLMQLGIIDKNYNMLDERKLTNLLREASNNLGEMMPVRVDNVTTALSANFNKFGLYYVYQIDGVETESDVKSKLLDYDYEKNYDTYFCSLEYSKSEFFKRNKNFYVNLTLVNSHNRVIYKYKKPIWTC